LRRSLKSFRGTTTESQRLSALPGGKAAMFFSLLPTESRRLSAKG
jgi:hypothetical protein